MVANGRPIQNYRIKPGPVKITHSLEYERFAAMAQAGMSVTEYEALPGTPLWCTEAKPISKCHVVMAYRMGRWIEAASHEAQRRDIERVRNKRR